MAMNAYRNYNTNTSALSGNLEKLSSGYKINRAGDDAAGLAISEKMRAQITGLDAAQKNVKDGISLVKTAEGAMQEIQDMLNRMDYLATQSANGTYQDEVDRENLQKEVDALKTEIDRIADSANFNGIKLLDGSLGNGSSGSSKVKISGDDRILASVIGKDEKGWEVQGKKTIYDAGTGSAAKGSFAVDLSTLKFNVKGSGAAGSVKLTISVGGTKISGTTTVDANATSATILKALAGNLATKGTVTINDVKWTISANGSTGLKFSMKSNPIEEKEAQTNFSVSFIDFNGGSGTTTVEMTQSSLHGTETLKEAKAVGNSNLANTTFRITASDIVDGAKITIGSKTVTLAVGADSNYKDEPNKVDLTTMEAGDIDLNKALAKISQKFSSVQVEAKDNKGNKKNVSFMVGFNDGSSGEAVGITVQRTTAIGTGDNDVGAYFNSIDRLASMFKMEYTPSVTSATGPLTLQIGDTSDNFNQMKVAVSDMHVSALKIDGINISSQAGAQAAIQKIKDAINSVSSTRGDLGAIQNRLEHTGNNLSVMAENIQDAESTIRDTDVANEMMSYVKNNILVQSAQAMLAQANQVPQGVLQLLG